MKKVTFFMFSLLIAGMTFISSCSSDDNSNPSDLSPTLTFIGGTGYTSSDVTLTAGTPFKVGLNGASNTLSNSPIQQLIVTRIYNNKPFTVLDTAISVNNFSVDIIMQANYQVGAEAFYFKVVDKDNQSAEISFTINTTAAVTNDSINTFTMVIMGAQESTNGSSFASIDGSVYQLAEAKINSAKVDWLYYYGATNHATLAAPDDASAATIFTNSTNGLQTWAVKNPTRFKTVTDPIIWDAITDDGMIKTQTASGVDQTKIPNLSADTYLSFITASGKKGMIKVESISGTESGTITLSVKVQK
jgi:hypothetical protein